MSSDSQLQQIGEEVLSNHLKDSPNNIPNDPNQDQIHQKSVDLSHLLNSIGNTPKSLSPTNVKEITDHVNELVSLLSSIGKAPSMNVGAGQKIFEAYNIICYSLLLLQKTESESKETTEPTLPNQPAFKNQDELDNYSQLICENEQLKAEIQRLIEQNQLISAESQNYHKVTNILCQKFNLPNDSDIGDIASQLGSYELNDQEKFISSKDKEIADLLTSRESLKKQVQDLKNEIDSMKLINHEENQNAKIFVLEADIKSLQLQNKSLQSELSKQKDSYRTLKQNYQNVSSENETKSLEIEDLQMKLNKISIERDEIQNLLNIQQTLINSSDSKMKDDQISGMNKAIDKFFKQIEDITKELSEVSESRHKLLALVHKQQLALDSIDQLNSIEKERDKNDNDNYNSSFYIINSITEKMFKSPSKSNPNSPNPKSPNHNTIDSNKDEELNQILSDESQKIEDRIIAAFSYLQKQNQELKKAIPKIVKSSPIKTLQNQKEETDNESSHSLHLLSLISETETDNEPDIEIEQKIETKKNECESDYSFDEFDNLDPEDKISLLKKENQRMCVYMMSIFRFIDKVSNSSETQDWMLDSLSSAEIRDSLVSQCKRVESFIKQRHIECEGFFSFTDLPKYVSNKIDEIADRNELVAIVMMSGLANDVMRKYLLKLEEQMETLTEELKAMKFEISHTEPSNNEELEQMKLDNIQMAQELKLLKRRLQDELTESNPIPDIEKAKLIHKATLALKKEIGRTKKHSNRNKSKSGSNYREDEFDDDNENTNYHLILETKLYDEIQKNEQLENDINKISEEAKNAVHMLKKKIQALQNKIKEADEKITDLSTNLENTQKELEDSTEKIGQKENENKKLSETITELTTTITQMNDKKQAEFERMTIELRNASDEKIRSLEEEVQKITTELHEKDEDNIRKLKEMKKSYKAELKDFKSALEKRNQLASDIHKNYDPLISDLKQKLADSREQNAINLKNLQSQETEVKELKSEMSALKVELKMNQMKLMANEEKMKRDKNLFETQLKMKMMSMETSHSSEMEQLRSQYERQFHDFLVSISSNFKEFIDFNSPITSESTTKLFQNVRHKIDSLKQNLTNLENNIEEIGDVKTILNLSKDSEILPRLTDLVNKEKELERHTEQINDLNRIKDSTKDIYKKEEEAKKWEKWARRLHATVTDEFSSAKTNTELQFAIEEQLMSSIGQRQIWRHIEILRTEKNLLLNLAKDSPFLKNGQFNGQINNKEKNIKNSQQLPYIPVPDILTLSLCFSTIYRLQKLSGHLHGAITFYDENASDASFSNSNSSASLTSPQTDIDKMLSRKSKKKSDVSFKKYPILSFK